MLGTQGQRAIALRIERSLWPIRPARLAPALAPGTRESYKSAMLVHEGVQEGSMAMPDTGARPDLVRTAFLLELATLYLLIKEGKGSLGRRRMWLLDLSLDKFQN